MQPAQLATTTSKSKPAARLFPMHSLTELPSNAGHGSTTVITLVIWIMGIRLRRSFEMGKSKISPDGYWDQKSKGNNDLEGVLVIESKSAQVLFDKNFQN